MFLKYIISNCAVNIFWLKITAVGFSPNTGEQLYSTCDHFSTPLQVFFSRFLTLTISFSICLNVVSLSPFDSVINRTVGCTMHYPWSNVTITLLDSIRQEKTPSSIHPHTVKTADIMVTVTLRMFSLNHGSISKVTQAHPWVVVIECESWW